MVEVHNFHHPQHQVCLSSNNLSLRRRAGRRIRRTRRGGRSMSPIVPSPQILNPNGINNNVNAFGIKDGIEVPNLTRLPREVVPKRYELHLTCEPDTGRYHGHVNIRIYVHGHRPVNTVWLHSKGLTISRASIRFSQFAQPVEALKVVHVAKKEAIGVHFAAPIEEGTRAWLSLGFEGKLSNGLEGFFSLPFVGFKGEKRLGAATMFAATEARSCFPCFDEPDFKAVFALVITVPNDLNIISNMPLMDSVMQEGDKRTDHFEWTKEMSTYLVCIVIGQFEHLQALACGDRTTVRVYTPVGQRERGRFALNVAKRSLEFFNDYFGKRYPLPKLDLVALSRLSVGAMENWGVITCRETGMITDDSQNANPSTLVRVATLIAHEVSHQWFGNLVTMRWWDGLYLNEGFATLMQYICIDHLYPEFKVFNRFCAETVIPALGLDALQNSHPIEMLLKDSSEISQAFDKITYCKGASVLFMLHEFLGEKTFKEAIQEYMQTFAYDNATTEDLWHSLSVASDRDVGAIMDSWIRKVGFPLVRAKTRTNEDGQTVLILKQERFSSVVQEGPEMIWSIPLKGMYMKQGSGDTLEKLDTLFDKRSVQILLPGFNSEDPSCFVKLNPGLTGFYRVQYSKALFQRLLSNLQSPHLSATDRMGLFDDQVAMVLSNGGSTTRILQMVELFREFETEHTVWKSVCTIMHQIQTLTWPTEETADLFDRFCLKMFLPGLQRLGMRQRADDSHNDTMLRCMLMYWLAVLGDEEVQEVSKEMFRGHVEGLAPVPSGMREAVFRGAMVNANQQTLDQMISLFREAEFAEDRLLILSAMGAAHDPNILQQVLEFSLTYEVHPQEALSAIMTAASNRFGHRLTWNFFVNHVDQFLDRYLGGLFILSKLLKSVTESFTDQDGYQRVVEFFGQNKGRFVGSEHALEQAEEHVRLNCIWRNNDIAKIQDFLEHYFNA